MKLPIAVVACVALPGYATGTHSQAPATSISVKQCGKGTTVVLTALR
jgi:hypothetical protein